MSWYDEWIPSEMEHSPLPIQTMDEGELRAQSLMIRALTRFTTFVLEEGRLVENMQEQGNFLICTIIFLSTLTLIAVSSCIFHLNGKHEFISYRRGIIGGCGGPLDLPYEGVTSHNQLTNREAFRLVEDVEEMLRIEQDESEIDCTEYSSNHNDSHTSTELTDLSE